MTKFKVGDRVRIKSEPSSWASLLCAKSPKNGTILYPFETEIEGIKEDRDYTAMKAGNYGWSLSCLIKEGKIELINKSKSTMSKIIDTIKLARLNEPEKTLVKAELMNLDGSLTESGKEALNDLLVQKFKEELKTTYATPILEAKE